MLKRYNLVHILKRKQESSQDSIKLSTKTKMMSSAPLAASLDLSAKLWRNSQLRRWTIRFTSEWILWRNFRHVKNRHNTLSLNWKNLRLKKITFTGTKMRTWLTFFSHSTWLTSINDFKRLSFLWRNVENYIFKNLWTLDQIKRLYKMTERVIWNLSIII